MSELNNHVILSHIDSPARILFWPVEEFAICVVPLCLGMVLDYLTVGGIMSVIVMIGFRVFNKRFGKKRFQAITYWYLPTSRRLKSLRISPSHVRIWGR